jgi:hypothetical protein
MKNRIWENLVAIDPDSIDTSDRWDIVPGLDSTESEAAWWAIKYSQFMGVWAPFSIKDILHSTSLPKELNDRAGIEGIIDGEDLICRARTVLPDRFIALETAGLLIRHQDDPDIYKVQWTLQIGLIELCGSAFPNVD